MPSQSGWNFWLTQWNWQPSILLGTIITLGAYLYAVGPLRQRYHLGDPVSSGRFLAFLLGVFLMFLALFSPLDALGDDYLFSAHMVQHLFLTTVGPILLLVGLPAWLIAPLLHRPVLLRLAKLFTNPFCAFLLFNFNFWLWHAPALYDATLINQNLHILEHLTFIVLGVFFWWPIFGPEVEGLPRLSLLGQVGYLFFSGMPNVALGAGLTFLPPLYTRYIYAPHIWGLSAATDQQLGGLLMWIPGNIFAIIVMSGLFIRWMQQQEAKQRVQDELLSASDQTEALSR